MLISCELIIIQVHAHAEKVINQTYGISSKCNWMKLTELFMILFYLPHHNMVSLTCDFNDGKWTSVIITFIIAWKIKYKEIANELLKTHRRG